MEMIPDHIHLGTLAEILNEPLTREWRLYQTREAYSNRHTTAGGYKVLKTPEIWSHYTFLNDNFRNKYNITDKQSFINLLNTYGYCKGIVPYASIWGVTFDLSQWVWRTDTYYPDDINLVWHGPSSPSIDGGEIHVIDFSIEGGHFHIWAKEKVSLPGVPSWMCEKNHYKFTPDNYEKKSLPNESTELYFGLEFEVDSEYSYTQLQHLCTQVEPKQEPFFYFKHDGTISDSSKFEHEYEIVTLPCTRRYLLRNMRILFEKIQKHWGLDKFHCGSSTGVHVHMSGSGFYSDLHIRKFITIWNQYDRRNSQFVERLARRVSTDYCKPNQRLQGQTLARRLQDRFIPYGGHPDKYSACRRTPNTVEVRVFRGGFDYDHFKHCLDAACAMFDFADKCPIRDIGSPRFESSFLAWLSSSKYKTLKKEFC